MNTRSTEQQRMMGKDYTSQASDDHDQAPYQLSHLSVLSYW